MVDGPEGVGGGDVPQDFVKMFAVGVGDENLAEGVLRHNSDDGLDAARVQFVEDIVQEEQRLQ